MIELKKPYRKAIVEDDVAMAELVNMAGEGLPLYLWSEIAGTNENPWETGRSRARREHGGFSYCNTVVREEQGKVVGLPHRVSARRCSGSLHL